jgi:MPBQ/MSBQ methyltransferase
MSLGAGVPAYFDRLIDGLRRGKGERWVHLGHWNTPPRAEEAAAPGAFARAQARLDEVLLGMADLRDGQRVLDVGCGFGASLDAVNRAFSGMQLAGANIDPRQLELCRMLEPRPANRFEWHEADACRLPFADASFDRVLCIEAMFHFASRRAFFAEAARVLAPGGVMVASDILLARVDPVIGEGFGPWPEAHADHRALAAAAGLRCDVVFDATRHTLPSHRYTTPSSDVPQADAPVRAALALRRLHEDGRLRYLYLRFSRPS